LSLTQIETRLRALYDLDGVHRVEDFVCDERVARQAAAAAVERGEALLVLEEPDDVSIGLYLVPGALEVLADDGDWLGAGRFESFCLVAEGVSHFLYLMFRLSHEHTVTQLELEVQAEVDKYALGLLAGNGVGLLKERSRALRQRLFCDVAYLDDPGTPEGDRYREATRAASGYTAHLERRFVERGDMRALAAELRRFYRRDRTDKLRFT